MRKLLKRFRTEHFFGIVVWLASSISATAEIQNDPKVFGQVRSCSAYDSFLDERRSLALEPCHPLERFVVLNSDLEDERFLFSFSLQAGYATLLRTLIELNLLLLNGGKPEQVFSFSAIAGRLSAIQLSDSGDIERAHLYSNIIYSIQLEALHRLCAELSDCEDIRPPESIREILGQEFEHLDLLKDSKFLLCLNRIDAFSVPIRTVLTSRAFEECVVPDG